MSKPSVVLLGFFGRGNAGDEAFLHVQYELLKDNYHVIVPIERHNAVGNFHEWYPYNECEVINYDDVPRIYGSDVTALHIGGGSLPFGFSGQFLLTALDAKKRTLITGVDASMKPNLAPTDIRYDIYGRLDFFSVRSLKSVTNLRQRGIDIHYGADWALGLQAIEPPPERRGGALVTVRDFGEPGQEHVDSVRLLHEYLERQGHRVRYLPFAPDDRRVLDRFPTANADNIENCWHDPRQVKGFIKTADIVISVGRLHTLIMSLTCETPTLAIDPHIMVDGRHIVNRKNLFFCEEVGLPFYHSVQEMIDAYGDGINQRLLGKNFAPEYFERFRSQTDLVQAAIAGEKVRNQPVALAATAPAAPVAAAKPVERLSKADREAQREAAKMTPERLAKRDAMKLSPDRLAKREAKRAERLAQKAAARTAAG